MLPAQFTMGQPDAEEFREEGLTEVRYGLENVHFAETEKKLLRSNLRRKVQST